MIAEVDIKNRFEQERFNNGEKATVVYNFLDHEPIIREVGLDSQEMFPMPVLMPDGTTQVLMQPEFYISNGLYNIGRITAEKDMIIVKPSYIDKVLRIDAYDSEGNEIKDYEFNIYLTGYGRVSDNFKFPIILKNNTVDNTIIEKALQHGFIISNTDENITGVKIDCISKITQFDISILQNKHFSISEVTGFIKGVLEINKN